MTEKVVIELPEDIAQQVRTVAAHTQCSVEEALVDWIRRAGAEVEREARGDTAIADRLNQGLEWLTRRGPEEVIAARERILGEPSAPREIPAGKTVLDVLEGKWPGTETDVEIRDVLGKIS